LARKLEFHHTPKQQLVERSDPWRMFGQVDSEPELP
jgi:hypothetical protein